MLNDILDILRDIAEIIARNGDYSVVLPRIAGVLADKLKVDVCSVYVLNGEELILTATRGLKAQSVGHVTLRVGEGLTGHCFESQEVLNLSYPEQHPKFKFFQNTGEECFKSYLSLPLTVGGRCVGVLVLQRRSPERFPDEVVDMGKSISAQLANIILNASIMKALAATPMVVEPKPTEPSRAQLMLRGMAANAGIAVGRAVVFEATDLIEEVEHANCENPVKELELFRKAVDLTKAKTIELEKKALSMISEADASIFNAHLLFLEDPSFLKGVAGEIGGNGHTAEFGVKTLFKLYEKRFLGLQDQVFKERLMDMKDVMLRLLETIKAMKGGSATGQAWAEGRDQVLIAKELLPSDLIRMPVDSIIGIVTERGGLTAHVAILAKALEIPALMGVKDATRLVGDDDEVILDCHAELMYARPTELLKSEYREMAKPEVEPESDDLGQAFTADGVGLALRGNISLICETATLAKYGAQGIGLYRSEFLFMVRDYLPSEDDQFKVFSKIIKAANGEEVYIRALDVGGDKPIPYLNMTKEDNPALGNRGARFLLSRRDFFKSHLKAILRAGAGGKLNLLFPMISAEDELLDIKSILAEVTEELVAKAVPHAASYRLGIMLEVPSALFELERLIPLLDFMSVGSNDLFQYLFAADRGNETVAARYQPLGPVFLRVLRDIGALFKLHPDKTLSLCGEMAGNPLCAPFLVGCGFRELSMSPRLVPQVKKTLKAFTVAECEDLLAAAVGMGGSEAVRRLSEEALAAKGL